MRTHRSRTVKRGAAIAATALAATLSAAPAAGAYTTIGSGRFATPGLAVDSAGTAYVAWNGPENGDGPLYFCRLPRGATACDAGVSATLTSPGTSLYRPFIAVSGDRVVIVQHRYGNGVPGFGALFAYTSTNRGVSFGMPKVVGKANFAEAVVGPNDTMTGTWQHNEAVQNVPIDGSAPVDLAGISTRGFADFKPVTPGQYSEAIGLLDAGTPLTLFNGAGTGYVRRYDGSGDINQASNWTAPVAIGPIHYPRLAGGPSGLHMITGDGSGNVLARKYDGATFGSPVTIGPGGAPGSHLYQDAAGRLHAVFAHGDGNGSFLVHAVSDDGVTWRKGRVVSDSASAFGDMRVATAPDHIGLVVWVGGPNEVRVSAVGPDAPVGPVAPPPPPPPPPPVRPPPPPPVVAKVKPKPTFTASGSARRTGRRFRIRVKGALVLPAGVAKAVGCTGKIEVTVTRAGKLVTSKTVTVKTSCAFSFGAAVTRAKVGRSRKLAVRLRFSGNTALAPVAQLGSIRVRR